MPAPHGSDRTGDSCLRKGGEAEGRAGLALKKRKTGSQKEAPLVVFLPLEWHIIAPSE